MNEKPELNNQIDSNTFRNFYYLKEELVDFCRKNGIPTSGGKLEISDRIALFLDTGEIKANVSKSHKRKDIQMITEEAIIETDFVCSEKHRAFFKEKIGKSFSFNVAFQKWLKTNAGKTYKEAIDAYYLILKEKKEGKTTIDKQFEYNTYIRDFFENNPGRRLEEAIACWKYKKSIHGHNRYESTDLSALDQ